MSHSAKTLHEFGAVSLHKDLRLKTGSTSSVSAVVTPAPTALADAAATLTVAQLKTGLFSITPTATRILTLPTAALMVDFLSTVGDSIEFTVINLGADTFHATIAAGTGGSVVGFADVRDSSATTAADTGSGTFRVRQTNVGSGTEAYVVYRLS